LNFEWRGFARHSEQSLAALNIEQPNVEQQKNPYLNTFKTIAGYFFKTNN
jgi:hypothetical protein